MKVRTAAPAACFRVPIRAWGAQVGMLSQPSENHDLDSPEIGYQEATDERTRNLKLFFYQLSLKREN